MYLAITSSNTNDKFLEFRDEGFLCFKQQFRLLMPFIFCHKIWYLCNSGCFGVESSNNLMHQNLAHGYCYIIGSNSAEYILFFFFLCFRRHKVLSVELEETGSSKLLINCS